MCSPDTGAVVLECPVTDCRREVWALPAEESAAGDPRRALIGAFTAPDLSRRFAVDQCRLLLNGRELLSGPADLLAAFAEYLNAADPAEHELPGRIRALIQATRARCHFQPGRELVRIGFELLQQEERRA